MRMTSTTSSTTAPPRRPVQVLNAYCVETLVEVAEVLAPLPSIGAEMAALDIAPVPGDIHAWVPEQNKVWGSSTGSGAH